MTPRLLLHEFARRGEAYHFARVSLSELPTNKMHRHNFYEIFWVEDGQGIHHINGQRRDLFPGLSLCIKASDAHCMRAKPGHSLRIVNIAFPINTWLALRRRYYSDKPDFFAGPLRAREFDLKHLLATELFTAATDLETGNRSRLRIERFLINFFYRLSAETSPQGSPTLPGWLEEACLKIREDKAFAGGVPALARLAGRCSEHLARQARLHLGKTPTDIVNEARLAFAANKLTTSHDSIAQIALDCGIENLSHFYGLFRRHYKCTPRRHRIDHQRIIGGAVVNA